MSTETEAVQIYFDAWNAHDPEAILASMTTDGTYSDPVGGDNLSGQDLSRYVSGLFEAFPDLRLELICNKIASNGMVAAPWLLFGTHRGPVGELQASGNSVVLPGCDFIEVLDGKARTVRGYFDPAYLFSQLQ